ncbi:hypothetical protein TGDOM2_398010, partial [Toxoplasma gondii GAB2-2007-GAL-DOM2]
MRATARSPLKKLSSSVFFCDRIFREEKSLHLYATKLATRHSRAIVRSRFFVSLLRRSGTRQRRKTDSFFCLPRCGGRNSKSVFPVPAWSALNDAMKKSIQSHSPLLLSQTLLPLSRLPLLLLPLSRLPLLLPLSRLLLRLPLSRLPLLLLPLSRLPLLLLPLSRLPLLLLPLSRLLLRLPLSRLPLLLPLSRLPLLLLRSGLDCRRIRSLSLCGGRASARPFRSFSFVSLERKRRT